MEGEYNVVFTGQLRSEFSREEVMRQLVAISGMTEEQVEKFLSGGKPRIIKKGLERQQAEKFLRKMEGIGLQMRLSPIKKAVGDIAGSSSISKPESPQSSGSQREEPQHVRQEGVTAGDEPQQESSASPISGVSPEADNPYASPKADLKVRKEDSEEMLGDPRKVSASHGWVWIRNAMGMFFAAPLKWIGMSIIVSVLAILVNFVPFIGFIFNTILGIIFSGGLMMAAQAQSEGLELDVGYVFKGFSHNRNQLILVGVLYLVGALCIGLVVALFVGGSMWSMFSMGSGDSQVAPEIMMQNMPMILMGILIGMLFFIPLLMCLWFAASLVAIGNRNAITAFKLSFRGCLKNMVPFLVYGLVYLVVGAIVAVAFGGAITIFSFFLGDGGSFFAILLPMFIAFVLIGIPLMSITTLSVYTGYKDIYFESD